MLRSDAVTGLGLFTNRDVDIDQEALVSKAGSDCWVAFFDLGVVVVGVLFASA